MNHAELGRGKLKIRGKPEDIKRWVEECLHCYTTNWLGDGAHTELVRVLSDLSTTQTAKKCTCM